MKSPDSYPGRPSLQNLILQDAGAQTVTGTGSVLQIDGLEALVFQLDLTAAATESSDTLDVYVQTTIDGTNWIDIVHFTQVLGNGGAKRYFSKVLGVGTLTEFENATSLGAAAARNIMGSQFRVRWAITDASTQNASFTFSVTANGI